MYYKKFNLEKELNRNKNFADEAMSADASHVKFCLPPDSRAAKARIWVKSFTSGTKCGLSEQSLIVEQLKPGFG